MSETDRPQPRATYRLQLNKDFTFANVEAIAPYLARLGISHAYLSPILEARPGSTHGYDVTDQTRINPELGTLEDFRRMAGVLRRHGIGLILDIVPNHMGIGGESNPYWLDVLEWGRGSRYAGWFDINWSPSEPSLKDKVLVPFLGSAYGDALANGKLELRFDPNAGSFAVWAEGAHRLPLAPQTYARILRSGEELTKLGAEFASLGPTDHERASELKERLTKLCASRPEIVREIEASVASFNGAEQRNALDELITAQHWRPARYFVAADDINYRRFFIVSDLAAIRIERDDVFDHVHRLTFQLVEEGLVEGLRIDHIDGLYDPKAYCLKLRQKCPRPIYLIVEKILAPHEQLRADWQVDGTTGYEFGAAVTQLLTDPDGQVPLTETYVGYAGRTGTLEAEEERARLDIVDYEMTAELDALTVRLRDIAVAGRATADLTRNAIRNGLRHVVSTLPVYRTYVDAHGVSDIDRRQIAFAIQRARQAAPAVDPAVFDFLSAVMTGELKSADPDAVLEAARRIQQYTGPVMAKGLEDTTLYRFNRLIALSDVGAKPDRYTRSVASFHDFNLAHRQNLPDCMLGTSTHDSKRGEDVRARIAALSGFADLWADTVTHWRELLDQAGAPAIEPNDSYYFFQLLLGAWPAEWPVEGPLDDRALEQFRRRIDGAMLKSVREARLRTNWSVPRTAYEDDLAAYVATALSPAADNAFLAAFRALEQTIGLSGAQNGLIGTALKLTVPSVPDIYQGAELWEQSMVDPDNRRAVDYAARQTLAKELNGIKNLADLMADWRSGAVKLGLIARILEHRRSHPRLYARGSYEPLAVTGPDADRVVAFARRHEGNVLLVMATLGPWRGAAEASVELPEGLRGSWRDLLRQRSIDLTGPDASPAALTDALPVTVLIPS